MMNLINFYHLKIQLNKLKIALNDEHPLKAKYTIEFKEEGTVIWVNDEQW